MKWKKKDTKYLLLLEKEYLKEHPLTDNDRIELEPIAFKRMFDGFVDGEALYVICLKSSDI